MAPATLKKRSEFLWVRGGRRWSAPTFVLEARARRDEPEPGPARFGFTVSKKVGGAVQRNRIRRRFRALTAALRADQMLPGFDYVIIARTGAIDRAFPDLRADLDLALTRVHQPPGQKRRGSKNA
ncbi:ribonuclease P protein component [Hyphomicrobium sp. NDB2Meth4]|uniref:ribonuclease P protein component n=1 Tax=Hyphomicrobium sp. NDB2Meth4 TaxID=1892846 RepID=UPI0009308286|nr:ribonuclease P protein component [Hyphomicrobium sp. NDB2Meth4]